MQKRMLVRPLQSKNEVQFLASKSGPHYINMNVARDVFWPPFWSAIVKSAAFTLDVESNLGPIFGTKFWHQFWTSILRRKMDPFFGSQNGRLGGPTKGQPKQLRYTPGAPFYDSESGPQNWPPDM